MWRVKQKQAKPKVKKVTSPQRQLLYRQIFIGLALSISIALIVTAVWHITRVASWQVNDVVVVGGRTIPHNQIKAIAEADLVGTYARLIPKRFSPMYPEDSIKEQISGLDRVKQVHLELDKNNNLVIAFEEHIPQALWCSEVDSTECFFIDSSGFAFAPAPLLSGGAFVRYITDENPGRDSYVAEKEYLTETGDFIEKAESQLSLFVTHVVRVGDYDIEYYVSGGGRIKVSQSMSGSASFNNLKTILSSDDFSHITPGSFNYIDLRFGDKIFVNEVTDSVTASTSNASSTLE